MGEAEVEKPKEAAEEEKKKEDKPMDATAAAEDKPKDAAAAEDKPKDGEEKKDDAPPPPPPPPPEEVEMRVYMHCEGCARKVKKILKRFDGVEDVVADSKSHKVVVKGKKAAADPMRVVERVQKKTGRKVELLSPIPPPTPPEEKKAEEEPEPPKPEEKEENVFFSFFSPCKPPVIAVVLKVHMHCEACAQGIRKRILKMKGRRAICRARPQGVGGGSEGRVRGVQAGGVRVQAHRQARGRRQVRAGPGATAGERRRRQHGGQGGGEGAGGGEGEGRRRRWRWRGEEEGRGRREGRREAGGGEGGGGGGGEKVEEKEGDKDAAAAAAASMYMHYPRFPFPGGYYAPPPGYVYQPVYPAPAYAAYAPPHHQPMAPQIFSDENPNACSVM
ncbi:Heavy metal-associated isoprenylated plant protein 7 [Zea mays]|uniref:Heavy metal-associated isoprenylated plant protein 7 n=1 Tax=Zea mays TaxID=4577 RepID=A0A3L6FZD1_MAIZE|nr:Heavy metal-associated isoprenylated plant protein 7 [Zea mays]